MSSETQIYEKLCEIPGIKVLVQHDESGEVVRIWSNGNLFTKEIIRTITEITDEFGATFTLRPLGFFEISFRERMV